MGSPARFATTLAIVGGLAVVCACGGGSSQSGRTRLVANLPASADTLALPDSVSCATRSFCAAAGFSEDKAAGLQRPLTLAWNGKAWSAQPFPAGTHNAALAAISCPAKTACVAVGSVIAGWNGSRWRVQRTSGLFDAVSCPAASACVAVGVTQRGKPVYGAWNGSTWRIGAMPGPRRPVQSLTLAGVSCSAPDSCMAVGDYSYGASARPSPAYRDRALAEHWDGSRWTIVHTVNVAHRERFLAVSCPGRHDCVAVGQANAKVTLAQRWNGTSWRTEPTPDYRRIGYSELTGVSCQRSGRCVAAGDYNLAVPFAEIGTASRWILSRLPLPAGPQQVSGFSVSCAGGDCEAVGSDQGKLLAERWNGASWQLQAGFGAH